MIVTDSEEERTVHDHAKRFRSGTSVHPSNNATYDVGGNNFRSFLVNAQQNDLQDTS